jgi:hypothetical protein
VTTRHGSSVMNYKDPDQTDHATTKLLGQRKALRRKLWKQQDTPRRESLTDALLSSTTPLQPLYRLEEDEEGINYIEPGTLP